METDKWPLSSVLRRLSSEIKAHALAEYPRESVGVVVDGAYRRLKNVACNPQTGFALGHADELLALLADAVVHSHCHPKHGLAPSAADMRRQRAWGRVWGIVLTDGKSCAEPWFWGPGVPVPPLIGREYRHGPSGSDGKGDCWALVRDWFIVERGIAMPEFPRDDEWWTKDGGADLYRRHFTDCGGIMLGDPSEKRALIRVGDVVLFQIRSKVPNHAAVYVGDGLMMHQPAPLVPTGSAKSRVEPGARWLDHATHLLRHKNLV